MAGRKNKVDFSRAADIQQQQIQQPQEPSAPTGPVQPQEPQPTKPEGNFLSSVIGEGGFFDRITPDDMGGLLRGRSDQWLPKIPYLSDAYANTVGTAFGVQLSLGESVINTVNWGTDQMNHVAAWTNAAAPGGIPSITWDQAYEVSAGQSVVSSYGATIGRAMRGQETAGDWISNSPFVLLGKFMGDYEERTLGTRDVGVIAKSGAPGAEFLSIAQEGFDVTDPEQRKKVFEETFAGQLTSGLQDAATSVALDPTIVGGKAMAFLRLGSKAGSFAGLSNRSVNTISKVNKIAAEADENLKYIQTAGAEGKWTALGEHIQTFIGNRPDRLSNHVFVEGSDDPQFLIDLAAQVQPDDFETGVALFKAAIGKAEGWAALRDSRNGASLYDQLANHAGIDPLQYLDNAVTLSDDQIRYGHQLIDDAENAVRQTGEAARAAETGAAGQLITRVGNAPSARMARWADAYREGALKNQFGKVDTGPVVVDNAPNFQGTNWVDQTIRFASSSRPIRAIRWVGKGTPSGIIHLKGGDGATSYKEMQAFLSKSSLTQEQRVGFYNDFLTANTVEQRLTVVTNMERAEVRAIAAKNNIHDTELADRLYNSYMSKRSGYIESFKRSGKDGKPAFAVDQDTGEIVRSPFLYTELEESFPLINQKVMNHVLRQESANKVFQALSWSADKGAGTLDTFNTLWKFSVLMRLGYTERNITEGMLRSLATIGAVALNPSALAHAPLNSYYYMKARGVARRMKHDVADLTRARSALEDTKKTIARLRDEGKEDDLARLQSEIEALDSQISQYDVVPRLTPEQTARLDEVNLSLAQMNEEFNTVRASIRDLSSESARLPRDISKLSRRKTNAQNSIKGYDKSERELSTNKSTVAGERANNDQLIEELAKIESRTPGQEQKLQRAIARKARLAEKESNIDNRLADVRQRRAEKQQLIETTNAELNAARNRTRQIPREIESAARRHDDLKQRRAGLRGERTQLESITSPRAHAERMSHANRMRTMRDSRQTEYNDIRDNVWSPRQPEMQTHVNALAGHESNIDEIARRIDEKITQLRDYSRGRKRTGHGENVMPGGESYAGAFDGPDGDIAALLSSADRTMQQTFDVAYESRRARMRNAGDYRPLDPNKINWNDTDAVNEYYDWLTIRLNQTWRNDPLFGILARATNDEAGRTLQAARRWLMSDDASWYRKEMSINGRALENTAGRPIARNIEEYINGVFRQFNDEIPAGTGLRQSLLNGAVTPGEVKAAFGSRDLPIIPGKVSKDLTVDNRPAKFMNDFVQPKAGAVMKWLGTIPETKLLRHPFYNAVYKRRQTELYNLARSQGQDVASELVQKRINRSAHAAALKATRKTMYTIERQSNASTYLRWIAPFFPAYENSLRTWGRIVYDNPAVLGYGNLMWNIPNDFGWVYDKDGNRVEHSNFLKDEGNYILYPEAVAKVMTGQYIPVPLVGDAIEVAGSALFGFQGEGDTLRSYQSGYNVVVQGPNIATPGISPMAQVPISIALRGKPEVTETFRAAMGDEMFNNIVPGGNPNTPISQMLLSTSEKRLMSLWQGVEGDNAFKTVKNKMLVDAYIDASFAKQTFTPAMLKAAEAKAEKAQGWLLVNSLVGFTPAQFVSKYEPQRLYWKKLLDDTNLPTLDSKVQAFIAKYPEPPYLAITRSMTETEYSLKPNQVTWDRIVKNPDFVERLDSIDPRLVGMFANMGSWDEPFSYAVYNELANFKIGPDGKPAKSAMESIDIVRNNQIADGWSEYKKVQDAVNLKLAEAGLSSVNTKSAAPLKQILRDAAAEIGGRYPAWKDEFGIYQDNVTLFVKGAREMVSVPNLVNEDKTVYYLSQYMQVRDAVSRKLEQTTDEDKRGQLKEIAWSAAAEFRNSDIGFADFYDKYLVDDDFRWVL